MIVVKESEGIEGARRMREKRDRGEKEKALEGMKEKKVRNME